MFHRCHCGRLHIAGSRRDKLCQLEKRFANLHASQGHLIESVLGFSKAITGYHEATDLLLSALERKGGSPRDILIRNVLASHAQPVARPLSHLLRKQHHARPRRRIPRVIAARIAANR